MIEVRPIQPPATPRTGPPGDEAQMRAAAMDLEASFLAEMLTLSGIVQAGNLMAFTLMCVMLTVIFVATGRCVFPMLWGAPSREVPTAHEPRLTTVPKLGFVAILTMLGTYTPEPFTRLLRAVAQSIGG